MEPTIIAFTGLVSGGKSTVINSLVKLNLLQSGLCRTTTHPTLISTNSQVINDIIKLSSSMPENIKIEIKNNKVYADTNTGSDISLLDLPGICDSSNTIEKDGINFNDLARTFYTHASTIMWVSDVRTSFINTFELNEFKKMYDELALSTINTGKAHQIVVLLTKCETEIDFFDQQLPQQLPQQPPPPPPPTHDDELPIDELTTDELTTSIIRIQNLLQPFANVIIQPYNAFGAIMSDNTMSPKLKQLVQSRCVSIFTSSFTSSFTLPFTSPLPTPIYYNTKIDFPLLTNNYIQIKHNSRRMHFVTIYKQLYALFSQKTSSITYPQIITIINDYNLHEIFDKNTFYTHWMDFFLDDFIQLTPTPTTHLFNLHPEMFWQIIGQPIVPKTQIKTNLFLITYFHDYFDNSIQINITHKLNHLLKNITHASYFTTLLYEMTTPNIHTHTSFLKTYFTLKDKLNQRKCINYPYFRYIHTPTPHLQQHNTLNYITPYSHEDIDEYSDPTDFDNTNKQIINDIKYTQIFRLDFELYQNHRKIISKKFQKEIAETRQIIYGHITDDEDTSTFLKCLIDIARTLDSTSPSPSPSPSPLFDSVLDCPIDFDLLQ